MTVSDAKLKMWGNVPQVVAEVSLNKKRPLVIVLSVKLIDI
jgi:hypothetical protein